MPQTHHPVNLDPFIANPNLKNQPHGVIPRVSVRNQDTITWRASQDFEIVDFRKKTDNPEFPADPGKPNNPFFRPLPFDARSGSGGPGEPATVFRVSCGPVRTEAGDQHYLTIFKVKATGQIIDPDFICTLT